MKTELYTVLAARMFSGDLTPAEEQELMTWAAKSEENRAELDALRRLGELVPKGADQNDVLAGAAAPSGDIDVMAAWEKVQSQMGPSAGRLVDGSGTRSKEQSWTRPEDRPGAAPPSKPMRLRVLRLVGSRHTAVAAAVVLLFASLLILLSNEPGEWSDVATSRGEMTTVMLTDGSTIMLNAETQVRYLMGDERRVELVGEAFFDVTSDGRPFLVSTPETTVRVLGTRFGVRSRSEATRVSVQEGRVLVEVAAESVMLGAEEGVEVRAGGHATRLDADPARVSVAWTEGALAFHKTPLREVVEELERRYDLEVELSGDFAASRDSLGTTLTATFPGMSESGMLYAICQTLACEAVQVDDSRWILQ